MKDGISLLVILFLSKEVELGSVHLEAPISGQEAKKKGGLSNCMILMPLQWDVKAGLLWPQFQRMLHCTNQIGREIGATVSPHGDVPRKWEPSAGSGM